MTSDNINQATQYLTFTLGEEQFAIKIAKAREILGYDTITKVPRMPDFLRGVINLRGNVVSVVDLRLKLGMSAIQKSAETRIVIVEIDLDGELMQMGVLADSVQEVIDLDSNEISPPPKIGTKINTEFIQGMGKQDDRFLIILDIDKVLSGEELVTLKSTAQISDTERAEPAPEPEGATLDLDTEAPASGELAETEETSA